MLQQGSKIAFGVVLFVFVLNFCGSAQADLITVHVVPHTHDDVGWLKTVDQYFIGSNQSIQNAGVQYILDTVVTELLANKNRTFIYVEIAFFMRWWRQQTPELQAAVKGLVAEGRLEFINGGWCMNDEAATYYPTIIDQMTEGHLFLKNVFGVTPTIGWHIDPFGHSATQARLFAEMGFNAFMFARIDYQDYGFRTKNKQMEFVWRPSLSLGKAADIFTSVLFGGYGPPPGFCFECGDDPIQDDPRLFDVNVVSRANDFANKIRQQANSYQTNNVMITMGSDFQYSNAHLNFKNIDKLMNYVNANQQKYGMKMVYSTPSRYVKAVNDAGLTWQVKTDDFFPYADGPHAFWTGYFTSRPGLKYYVRWCENLYHTVDNLYAIAAIQPSLLDPSKVLDQISVFAEALGVAQHHDAVSGTSKQHVAFDYAKRLSIGMTSAYNVIGTVAGLLAAKDPKSPPTYEFCPLLNISVCPVVTSNQNGFVTVTIYNPTSQARTEFVRVPALPTGTTVVYDSDGYLVPSVPLKDLYNAPVVYFYVTVPALGFETYFLKSANTEESSSSSSSSSSASSSSSSSASSPEGGYTLRNSYITVNFDANGSLQSLVKPDNTVLNVKQEYLWYQPSLGDQTDGQASGAYIFRPNSTQPNSFPQPVVEYVANNNAFVQEVRQRINSWLVQSIRIYDDSDVVEVEANVGPIDISDQIGKEVISRFTTDLKTNGVWYTDSNGLEMQKRVRNYRPTWNLTVTEPVAGNYYPINAMAYIKDDTRQFSVVNDRSQGCGSVNDGQIEIMVNRRLLKDDGRGVGEPLNETISLRIKQYLIFDSALSPSSSSARFRPQSQKMNKALSLLFSSSASSVGEWTQKYNTQFSSFVSTHFPTNVEVLTLKVLSPNNLLLRVHHLYATNEPAPYNHSVTFDLAAAFPSLQFQSVTPMSLSANQPLSNIHRLSWKTATSTPSSSSHSSPARKGKISSYSVTLNPMEIKTFSIQFQWAETQSQNRINVVQ